MTQTASMVVLAQPIIGHEEHAAIEKVLASGMLAQGPEVEAFETEFSTLVGGRPCVAVNSGTSALTLGLLASGIGRGDEVIVPSFSFAATANAVVLSGARPVFVDIEPASFCIDPDAALAAIGPRTAAIVPVHLYGHPASLERLGEMARMHKLALVEDAAQAHAASFAGRPVGTFGTAGAFSFYATKNMTTGEGGLIACADEEIARRARLLRNQGMDLRYYNEIVGYNVRMTDLQAAIGRVQLRRLAGWNIARQANAEFLNDQLADLQSRQCIGLPSVAPGSAHVWHQYTVRSHRRDALARSMHRSGIATGVYYPTPIHRLPSYDLTLDLPHTARASAEVLSVPIRPDLTEVELKRVAIGLREGIGE